MNEVCVRFKNEGTIFVETLQNDIKSIKQIKPNDLVDCFQQSLMRPQMSTGILPRGCISYMECENHYTYVCIQHIESRANISYMGTAYENFPLPKMVVGFLVSSEKRISKCRMGIVVNTNLLKPDTPMFSYPFSNVTGFDLCTGQNVMPKCKDVYALSSLPAFILEMPNNNDHFKSHLNKQGLEMRDLLECLKDKEPDYYYNEVLIPNKFTLKDFIVCNS